MSADMSLYIKYTNTVIKPLTTEFCNIIYKNSVRTSQETHYVSSYLYLKTLSCLFFKTQRFGDCTLSPSSRKT
jgi:hypothetical protein